MALIVFAVAVLLAALPAVHVMAWKGALAISCLACAWLFFARIIVAGAIGYPLTKITSARVAGWITAAFMDVVAIASMVAIDRRLVWSALVAVVFSEAFYNLPFADKRSDTPSAV